MARVQSADVTLHLVHGILGLKYLWRLVAWQLATGPGLGIGSGEIAVIAPEPASPHRNLKIYWKPKVDVRGTNQAFWSWITPVGMHRPKVMSTHCLMAYIFLPLGIAFSDYKEVERASIHV